MSPGGAGPGGEPELPSALDVLRMAACSGLLTGGVELVLLGVEKLALGRLVFLGRDVVWMTPFADLLWFVLLALPFALWRLLRRGASVARPAVAAYVGLGALATLFMYGPLHRGAAFLLACGIGIQAARMLVPAAAAGARLARGARRLLPVLVGALLLAGVGSQAWPRFAERRAVGRLPPATPGAPDVFLIVLDTVRAADLELYGHARHTTPQLVVWARSGVRFDRALATAPWTLASHGSMFTGRLPHELSVGWTRALDRTYPTLAEVLAGRGYATAGFAANTIFCTVESGLSRGFARWDDFQLSAGQVVKSSSLGRAVSTQGRVQRLVGTTQLLGRKSADEVNDEVFRWLDGRAGRPVFVFVNYFDAHAPYRPPAPFDELFGSRRSDGYVRHAAGREKAYDWLPEEVEPARDDYDRLIAYLDSRVGSLLAELDRRGRLRNSLVILTSDHGEEFGEHGFTGHGNSLYIQSVHVPLIVSWPGHVPAGLAVPAAVSLRDIPATVADLLGLPPPAFPGRSLARLWRDGGVAVETETVVSEVPFTPNAPGHYPVSRGGLRSLVEAGLRYIHDPARPGAELYDLDSDPGELTNLAGRPEREAQLRRFAALSRVLGPIPR